MLLIIADIRGDTRYPGALHALVEQQLERWLGAPERGRTPARTNQARRRRWNAARAKRSTTMRANRHGIR